jgi:LmbE family N-acetylglucosaminyl deacetylase
MLAGRRVSKVDAGEHLAGKLAALAAHASQLARPAGIPDTEDWPVLPSTLMDVASQPYELFLPWDPHS